MGEFKQKCYRYNHVTFYSEQSTAVSRIIYSGLNDNNYPLSFKYILTDVRRGEESLSSSGILDDVASELSS